MIYFKNISFISFSYFLGIIGLILIGPLTPKTIYFILAGFLFLGATRNLSKIPTFFYLHEILLNDNKLELDYESSNFLSSLIVETTIAFSGFSCSLLSRLFDDKFGFEIKRFYSSIFIGSNLLILLIRMIGIC